MLVSWSAPPSSPGGKIYQLVIPTAWYPCAFLWKISGMPPFSVCMRQLFESAEKDKFYSKLCCCLQSTLADDKVIILGDFNARVGQDADSWKEVLGRHSVGNCNDNRRLLMELCTEQQIVITALSSSKMTDLKQPGCILGPNIRNLLSTPLGTSVTSRTSFTPKWYPALNVTPTIAKCAANLGCSSNLYQEKEVS